MRILVLNANTTSFVTETVTAEARRVASESTEIVSATADFGAEIIGTRTEAAVAEHAALVLAARHAADCDAVVSATSYDTALKPMREMLGVPVVGMTEAALHAACMLGGPIGLIGFGKRAWPLCRELIESYAFMGRVAGVRISDTTTAYQPGDYTTLDEELVATAQDLIARDGAESIVLLGAVMAGAAHRIEARLPVPLIDGMRAAIPFAEALVRIGARKPSTGSYSAPVGRRTAAIDPALDALLSRGS
jgi:allantoin racemase